MYGYPYGAEVSFPLRLEELLRSRHPEHRWEIINVGGLSYGTERLRLLVEELVRYRPHLLILYTGHNEFIEKDFYTGRRQTTRVLGRVREVAGRLHLFRALESTLWRPPEPSAQEAMAFGINVVRREGHLPTSEEKTAAAARYQTNIKAILNSAHDHRVLPILCTVSSNLAGWRPGAGSFSPMLEDTPLLNASLALARASAAEQVGDREGALRALNQTLGIDPNHSEIHYRAGRLLRELRRPTEAKIHFRAALELDATPIRSFAAFNTVLREIARGQAVELVDIARAFESKCRDGIPDNTLFWDYCHPNMLGHELIALRLLPVVERLLGLQRVDTTEPNLRRADLREPVDGFGIWWMGNVAMRQSRPASAEQFFRRALALEPDDYRPLVGLGHALRAEGQAEEALSAFEQGVE